MSTIPSFKVVANDNDITTLLSSRLISLKVTDTIAGDFADSFELEVADKGGALALPTYGAVIDVSLGYGTNLQWAGRYMVDTVKWQTPAARFLIRGSGTPFVSDADFDAFQIYKNRSFDPQTIGAFIAQIASDHGMEPVVDKALAGVPLPHIDQTNGSDWALLTRIGRDYGAIPKINFGKLAFVSKASTITASGQDIPPVTLTRGQVTSLSVDLGQRAYFDQVIATWYDTDAAMEKEFTAGTGKRILRIRTNYLSAASAQAGANARLAACQRISTGFEIEMPGNLGIIAGAPLTLSQFREGVDGNYVVWTAEHTLSRAGLKTQLSGQTFIPEDPPAE